MNDRLWQSLRYMLIGAGMAVSGWFGSQATLSDVTQVVDVSLTVAGSAVSVGTMAWGLYVKFRTKAVPEAVAARIDIPTINEVTGAIELPTYFRN